MDLLRVGVVALLVMGCGRLEYGGDADGENLVGGSPDAGPDEGGQAGGRPTNFKLALTSYATCLLRNGELSCWGALDTIGVPVAPDGVGVTRIDGEFLDFSVGEGHICAREAQGIRCWGANQNGQLGYGDTLSRALPSVMREQSGRLIGRFSHSCALTEEGHAQCWGTNGERQLGIEAFTNYEATPIGFGDSEARWRDIATGQGHSCAIDLLGRLHCGGRNVTGEAGFDAEVSGNVVLAPVDGRTDWEWISAGQSTTCGIREGGEALCWGSGVDGQIGDGDLVNRAYDDVEPLAGEWRSITVNTFHVCGIQSDGRLWCWGRNIEHQLGLGDAEERAVPTLVGADSDWEYIETGRFHTCASKTDGRVFCWGDNSFWQLGQADLNRRQVPTEVSL